MSLRWNANKLLKGHLRREGAGGLSRRVQSAYVVRAFVRLREMLASNAELAKKDLSSLSLRGRD